MENNDCLMEWGVLVKIKIFSGYFNGLSTFPLSGTEFLYYNYTHSIKMEWILK